MHRLYYRVAQYVLSFGGVFGGYAAVNVLGHVDVRGVRDPITRSLAGAAREQREFTAPSLLRRGVVGETIVKYQAQQPGGDPRTRACIRERGGDVVAVYLCVCVCVSGREGRR